MDKLETIKALTRVIVDYRDCTDYDKDVLDELVDHLDLMRLEAEDDRPVFTLEEIQAARRSCIRLIEKRGGEILDPDYDGYMVIDDDEGMAFVQINLATGELPEDRLSSRERDAFERAFARFGLDHAVELPNKRVRLDVVTFAIVEGSKALMRYHTNALSDMYR